MSRNTNIALGTLVCVIFVLTSCAPAPTPTPTVAATPTPTVPATPAPTVAATPTLVPEETPKYGGVFRIGDPWTRSTMDPLYFKSPMELRCVWPFYNALVEFDQLELDKIVSALADQWEISSDGLTYTFHLRQDVSWHDGEPFTGEDVKYTYEAVLNPPEGQISQRKANLEVIDSIDVVDPYTVMVKLTRPNTMFLQYLASIPIVPKHAHSKGPFVDTAIGTGPFKFVSWEPGVLLEGVKNEDYFREGLPYLDGFERYTFADAAGTVTGFRAGQLDALTYMVPLDIAEVLQEELNSRIIELERIDYYYLAFNLEQIDKPWSDPRVRQAISYAIDREALIKTVTGTGSVTGFYPNVSLFALPLEEVQQAPGFGPDRDANLAEAKRLLTEAGYPDGFSAKLLTYTPEFWQNTGVFIQASLREIGIDLELTPADPPVARSMQAEKRFDMFLADHGTALADPDSVLGIFGTEAPNNFTGYSNSQFDELLGKQGTEIDAEARREMVWEMQRILFQEFPLVPLQGRTDLYPVQEYVKNYQMDVSLHYHPVNTFERVWLDK